MTTAAGYLTVERNAVDTTPNYRGVHRIPPFSQARFDRGFDDPYLFGERQPNGLLPSVGVARNFLQKYQEVYAADQLEIIFVCTGNVESGTPPPHTDFLGFDVADSAPPFYSFVGDPPSTPDIVAHLGHLNQNRLLSNVQDAEQYIQLLKKEVLRRDDPEPVIWQVFGVE